MLIKSVRDEFRKQGHEFYGAMICTIREADAFEFDEKVFRAWTASEGVACRLPHAVHTPMLEWPSTAKFWEMNITKTPKISSICERSFTRRFIGVEKAATYTTDPDKVWPFLIYVSSCFRLLDVRGSFDSRDAKKTDTFL